MDWIGCWAPLSMGFSRQQYWSGFPFPGDLPGPGMESKSRALTGGFFTTEPLGRPICKIVVAVQSLNHVWLSATPWTALHQASLVLYYLLEFAQNHGHCVMLSIHFILCCPLLLLPSIFPRIRAFFNESGLPIRWPGIGDSASPLVHSMNIQDYFL